MSTGIQNYPNIEPADSDYPDGQIKDKDLSLPGTPVNKLVYGDMHQTLAKILRLAGVLPNGLPDNEYNGFQYVDSAGQIFRPHGLVYNFDRNTSLLVTGDYNPFVKVEVGAPNSGNISLDESVNHYFDGGTVTVRNDSSFTVVINASGSDTVNAGASYNLTAGSKVRLVLNKQCAGGPNWEISNT